MNLFAAIKSKVSKPKASLKVQNPEGIDTYAFMAKNFINACKYKTDEALDGSDKIFLNSLMLGTKRVGITFHFDRTPGKATLKEVVVYDRDVMLHSIRWTGSRTECIGLGFQVNLLEVWAA